MCSLHSTLPVLCVLGDLEKLTGECQPWSETIVSFQVLVETNHLHVLPREAGQLSFYLD